MGVEEGSRALKPLTQRGFSRTIPRGSDNEAPDPIRSPSRERGKKREDWACTVRGAGVLAGWGAKGGKRGGKCNQKFENSRPDQGEGRNPLPMVGCEGHQHAGVEMASAGVPLGKKEDG